MERQKARMRTNEIQPNDLFIVFISSHGFIWDDGFRLQGSDFQENVEENTSVSFEEEMVETEKSRNELSLQQAAGYHVGS